MIVIHCEVSTEDFPYALFDEEKTEAVFPQYQTDSYKMAEAATNLFDTYIRIASKNKNECFVDID
jgi:hypothetical protein